MRFPLCSLLRTAVSVAGVAGSLTACASGEPLDDAPAPLELAAAPVVAGLVYVDVADPHGRPLIADAVFIGSDTRALIPATCFDRDASSCPTWFADFEADAEIRVEAQLCGETFLGIASVDAMIDAAPDPDALLAAHVTVTADVLDCRLATRTH